MPLNTALNTALNPVSIYDLNSTLATVQARLTRPATLLDCLIGSVVCLLIFACR